MSVTQSTDLFNPQILIDAVAGRLKGKTAFMGSVLVSSGAVMVSGTMPKGGKGAIGRTIDIPYWGSLPPFAANAEGSSPTPSKIAQTSEQATVARSSLAVETSVWAQGLGMIDPASGDPYAEGARQAQVQAVREMDRLIVAEAATTPLVYDVYSATVPVYLDHRQVVRASTLWGDEQDDIVAMVTHSQALADLAEMTDTMGRQLLSTVQEGPNQVAKRTFCGMPLVVSDKTPLTGSSMGTVSSTGTTPPVMTITGTPLGPWQLVVDCQTSHASTTTIKFSVDGGNTYSDAITVSDDGVPVALTDTAVDSLVGVNGATGISVAFASGTFNADNAWTATAKLKVTSLIAQQGALAFWYNAERLGMKTDVDILEDTDLIAMHLYYAEHLYRRRRQGNRAGVVKLVHNVRNFNG